MGGKRSREKRKIKREKERKKLEGLAAGISPTNPCKDYLPEIKLNITSETITAKPRRTLKAVWSYETISFDIPPFWKKKNQDEESIWEGIW